MKKLFALFPCVLVFGTGCALQRAVEINPETKALTKYTGISFLNRSALEGLSVAKKTKTSSSLLNLEKAGTETQAEALEALGKGLATGLVEGAKAAK